jgi:hypothetical protein
MNWIRTAGWRPLMVVGGVSMALGGRMHPEADASGSLREELAEMTADDAWVPGHTLVMFGTFALVAALWFARSVDAWPRARRWVTATAVAMSLYAVETVFHLAAVVDAEHLAHGHAAPVSVTHIGLAIVLYPVSGLVLAAFGGRLVATESGVRRIVPVLAVVAGLLHASSVPGTLVFPDAELSPVFAGAGITLALWSILTGLVGSSYADRSVASAGSPTEATHLLVGAESAP